MFNASIIRSRISVSSSNSSTNSRISGSSIQQVINKDILNMFTKIKLLHYKIINSILHYPQTFSLMQILLVLLAVVVEVVVVAAAAAAVAAVVPVGTAIPYLSSR